jgi:hypothetical protein
MTEQMVQKIVKPILIPVPHAVLQRACDCGQHTAGRGECEDCRMKRQGLLQRVTLNQSRTQDVPPIVHEVLHSSGQPLDASTRSFMETRFGRNFSNVRVHTDDKAAKSAQAVNAHAYTVGRDIVFGSGKFAPQTNEGRRLVAHELTHVVQQREAQPKTGIQPKFIGNIDDQDMDGPCRMQRSTASGSLSITSLSQTDGSLIQREIIEGCMAPSEIPGVSSARSSTFGLIAEEVITLDYCTKLGCAPFVTDYFDNPVTASYIAFLAAKNPHLTAVDIATLAVLSQIELNRPDILTHKPVRQEFEEIKPNSVSGRAAGGRKVGNLIGFYGIWSLPYTPGIRYVPTPKILIATAPGPIEVFLRVQRLAPGLTVYDICVRGDRTALTIAAIIAILLLVIAIILSRGRIIRGNPIPLPSPLPIPAFGAIGPESAGGTIETARAAADSVTEAPGNLRTKLALAHSGDIFEQEADTVAEQVTGMHL